MDIVTHWDDIIDGIQVQRVSSPGVGKTTFDALLAQALSNDSDENFDLSRRGPGRVGVCLWHKGNDSGTMLVLHRSSNFELARAGQSADFLFVQI